jgi:RecB family endonuclease NucS
MRYYLDLGIVKAENGNITFANPIYREIITRVLNSSFQGGFTGKEEYTAPFFVRANGSLDMDKLLIAFQQFYRENSEHWLGRFQYKEAGHQLLLMAFLQRIVNGSTSLTASGGGRIEREMAVGSGRTDLAVYWKNEVHVIEMKLKRNPQALPKGRTQLKRYLDTLGQQRGYLVLFELKPSTEISWEDRIKWTAEEFEGKELVVVEM